MRCFSSPGWLGYSRIKARLTAPPDLSQSSTPFRLLAPRHPPHALTSLAAPPSTPHACCQAREGSGGTSSLPWPEPPGHYRMISPSKARVTFRQASCFTDGTCLSLAALTRPNRTAQGRRSDATRTHTLSKTNKPTCLTAHQPPSTKYSWLKVSRGRLDMPLLDLSIGRPRRVLYWRCCLVSTGLANFFSSRFHPGFASPSRRSAFHTGHHSTRVGSGEDGNRTRDLLLAKQALYQLSYFPGIVRQPRVRVLGFEPRTSALSELRSSQLSYTRDNQPHQTQEPNRMVWLSPTPDCR